MRGGGRGGLREEGEGFANLEFGLGGDVVLLSEGGSAGFGGGFAGRRGRGGDALFGGLWGG